MAKEAEEQSIRRSDIDQVCSTVLMGAIELKMKETNDNELIRTISDFIEMGHLENIIAMFRQERAYYKFTGELIKDERYMVRMGLAVLFEQMTSERPEDVHLAIPSLVEALSDKRPFIRGEVVNLLGIIGTQQAREHVRKHLNDPDPQIAEIARDILAE